MRKLCLMVCFAFAALSCYLPSAEAAPLMVRVCGESQVGNEAQAEQDAVEKAVARVLSRILLPNEQQALYRDVLQKSSQFAGKMKVLQRREDGKSLYVLGQVPVDVDWLRAYVKQQGRAQQKKNDASEACFIVRIQGDDTAQSLENQQTVQRVFNDTLEGIGFQVDKSDEGSMFARQLAGLDRDAFISQMKQKVQNDFIDVTLAVIGEINILPSAGGTHREADVYLKAFDMVADGRMVADFVDHYAIQGADAQQAMKLICYKAALNSSRVLADRILSYWQEYKK